MNKILHYLNVWLCARFSFLSTSAYQVAGYTVIESELFGEVEELFVAAYMASLEPGPHCSFRESKIVVFHPIHKTRSGWRVIFGKSK